MYAVNIQIYINTNCGAQRRTQIFHSGSYEFPLCLPSGCYSITLFVPVCISSIKIKPRILFKKLWDNLQIGGTYIININENIYSKILKPLFGDANEIILLKKSYKNNYKEYIYIWKT